MNSKLPAKYDKKGQPNVVGSDELPFPKKSKYD